MESKQKHGKQMVLRKKTTKGNETGRQWKKTKPVDQRQQSAERSRRLSAAALTDVNTGRAAYGPHKDNGTQNMSGRGGAATAQKIGGRSGGW